MESLDFISHTIDCFYFYLFFLISRPRYDRFGLLAVGWVVVGGSLIVDGKERMRY